MMRLLPRALLVGLAAVALAAPVTGQRSDDQLNATSVALVREGQAALSTGKLEEARDALEAALVADPRNRTAFNLLARVAQRQKLYGKAVRLTNKALQLDPTDRDALAIQGEAMVEMGAVARARQNLAKLQQICAGGCPQVSALSAAINRGPAVAAAKPVEGPKTN